MLKQLKDMPPGIVAVQATGEVTKDDYDQVIEPLLERARRSDQRIRFLFHFPPDFEGFTPSAIWEDFKVGTRYLRRFQACAVVTDHDWIAKSTKAVAALLPMPVRVFDHDDFQLAVDWLNVEHDNLDHRLLPERNVLVLEPKDRLEKQDFDKVASIIDPWIEQHGSLDGLVIHTPEFPGWESVASFVQHVDFVSDHHEKVKRVALAADGKVGELLPRLTDHFVNADVQRFPHSDVDEAIEWAAGESSVR